MKKLFSVLLLFFVNIGLYAQNTNSLLWEISGKGLTKPSYLFGTIHITDKSVFDFPDSVFAKIAKCDVTAFEINMDSSSSKVLEMVQAKMKERNKSKKLEDYFSPKEIEVFKKEFKKKNISVDNFEKKTPYELMKRLEMRKERYKKKGMYTFLDAYIFGKAKLMNKTLVGLETIEDQLKVFDQLKKDDVKKIIDKSLDTTVKVSVRSMASLVKLYMNQEIDSIYYYIHDVKDPEYENILLTKRNYIMEQRIDSLININSTFICVGTAHLAGNEGLLELLKKRGYTVKPMLSPKTGFYKKLLPNENIDNWQEYSDNIAGMKVKLPGSPGPMNINGIDAMGYMDILTNHFYMFFSSPASGSKEEYYKQFVEGVEQKGEITGKRTIKYKNTEGMEFDCKVNRASSFKFRAVIVDSIAYLLMIGGPENFNKIFTSRFFDSFEIIERKEIAYVNFKDDTAAFEFIVPANFKIIAQDDDEYTNYKSYGCVDKKIEGIIGLTITDYKAGYYLPDLVGVFEESAEIIRASLKAEITETKDTVINGYLTRDYTMLYDKDKSVKARYMLRGNRLYLLSAEYTKNGYANEVEPRFNTFKFIPQLKTVLQKYTSPEKDFEVLAPANFKSEYDSSYGVVPHYKFIGTWPNSANFLSITNYKFTEYEYYKNDSVLQQHFKNDFVSTGDSLIDSSIVVKKGIKYLNYTFRSPKNNSIERNIAVIINGNNYYHLVIPRDLNNKADTLFRTVLNSFKITKLDKEYDITASKKVKLLNDVRSQVDSVFKKASAAIEMYKFVKADIPDLQKAAQSKLLDDTSSSSYTNTKKQLYHEIYTLLDSTEIISFIEKNYNSFPDSGYVRADAINQLARIHTSASLKLWSEYTAKFKYAAKLEQNYYMLCSNLRYDSIPEIKELYPALLAQIEKPGTKDLFYNITSNALGYKIVAPSLYEEFKPIIYKEAATEYDKLFLLYDTAHPYYEGNFYEAMTLLNGLSVSAEITQLNKKIIGDEVSTNKAEAYTYLIRHNELFDKKLLTQYLKDPLSRIYLYDELNKINRLDAFPANYKKQKSLAEGDIARNVYFEDNIGKIEFVKEKILPKENKRIFIYKVIYSPGEIYLGMAGPYPLNDKELVSKGDKTMVSTEYFDAMPIDEHVKTLLAEEVE